MWKKKPEAQSGELKYIKEKNGSILFNNMIGEKWVKQKPVYSRKL